MCVSVCVSVCVCVHTYSVFVLFCAHIRFVCLYAFVYTHTSPTPTHQNTHT